MAGKKFLDGFDIAPWVTHPRPHLHRFLDKANGHLTRNGNVVAVD